MKTTHRISFLALSIALLGCASNPFAGFYRDETASVPADVVAQRLSPYSGRTQIYSTRDQQVDGDRLVRRGYLMLGQASFQGAGRVTDAMLMEQARKVGADIVLYANQYQGADQSAYPLLQYHPGQTTTTVASGTANASAMGTGGYAHATGSYTGVATSTTSGTFSTTMVPITVHRYSHSATFWRKGRPSIFGVLLEVIPDPMRRELQRNTGALVTVVIEDSPAFLANILPGDIVIGIDSLDVISPSQLIASLPLFAGREVSVRILRAGEERVVKVRMNERKTG